MKKMMIFALLSAFLFQVQGVKAQSPNVFFGVDFSLAKAYGIEESASELIEAFDKINNLFISEGSKYNPSKAFKSKDMKLTLAMVRDRIENIDKKELIVDTNDYLLMRKDIEEQVKDYNTGDAEGVGAILIADVLDKSQNKASYHAVVFDIRTKKVISVKQVSGKAKGFGLRNFWAGSMRSALSQLAKSK